MKNEKGTIVLAGGVIGVIAAILVFFGNPANMILYCMFPERYHRCAGTAFSGGCTVYPPGDHRSGTGGLYHFTG